MSTSVTSLGFDEVVFAEVSMGFEDEAVERARTLLMIDAFSHLPLSAWPEQFRPPRGIQKVGDLKLQKRALDIVSMYYNTLRRR